MCFELWANKLLMHEWLIIKLHASKSKRNASNRRDTPLEVQRTANALLWYRNILRVSPTRLIADIVEKTSMRFYHFGSKLWKKTECKILIVIQTMKAHTHTFQLWSICGKILRRVDFCIHLLHPSPFSFSDWQNIHDDDFQCFSTDHFIKYTCINNSWIWRCSFFPPFIYCVSTFLAILIIISDSKDFHYWWAC